MIERPPAAGQAENSPRYRRLSGTDAFLVRLDRGSRYNHTLKIIVLDPSSDPDGWSFERYRALIHHHLSVATLLKKRYLPTPLGLHQPVWVDDPQFELDSHLRRVVCPAPGDMKEFCRLVESIYPDPLDHGRPLWQMWVVEGLEGGRVALLTLLHHAYADGAGVRGLLESVSSPDPSDVPDQEPPEWNPPPCPSTARRLAWAARDLPELMQSVPAKAATMLERRRLERDFRPKGRSMMPSRSDCQKPQPFGGLLTRSRRFACESFAMEELKEVRRAHGGTLNDVFLTCVAGSVRDFLLRRELPCDSPAVATMPFLAKPLEQRTASGGNFSSVDAVWLHVDVADPVERLAATRASAQVTKDHIRAVGHADPLLALADLMPGGLMRALGRLDERTNGRLTPGCNIVVSNAAGPREGRHIARWRIEHWFSTGQVMHGATLNFTAWSYGNQFTVCVFAGSPRVPDAWELIDGIRSGLAELLTIARSKTANSESAQTG